MFFKILCICIHFVFVCFTFKNIGNNGPFPLYYLCIVNCALPIASLDLMECIYCLNEKKNNASPLDRRDAPLGLAELRRIDIIN